MQAHVGDMVWCDGKIVTVPTKYTRTSGEIQHMWMQKPSKRQPNGSASRNG